MWQLFNQYTGVHGHYRFTYTNISLLGVVYIFSLLKFALNLNYDIIKLQDRINGYKLTN
jgi:hypothetical protein